MVTEDQVIEYLESLNLVQLNELVAKLEEAVAAISRVLFAGT